eukprot:NODE_6984_length_470_cov_112.980723.p2 GENE.NODE_6984_length_470_cov_112.980723~~NODE_6984_length_470_cov_112.980723.p2  ORF type:complete len:101 (-),score=11.22 NODE_6984_length_470_cov_112.980723:150-452(-)
MGVLVVVALVLVVLVVVLVVLVVVLVLVLVVLVLVWVVLVAVVLVVVVAVGAHAASKWQGTGRRSVFVGSRWAACTRGIPRARQSDVLAQAGQGARECRR